MNASDPTGHNAWYLFGSLLSGAVFAYASIMAATKKGRAQADWSIVAAFSGVMALGLGYSAYRAKGNSKNLPAPGDAPETPVNGSIKQSISSNTSAKQQAKDRQSMKEASELDQSLARRKEFFEDAYKQPPDLQSYKQGLTDKNGIPLSGRARAGAIRNSGGSWNRGYQSSSP
ncbi:hypothetical protein N7650_22105 [Pseudomonas sp. GD04058]|uniref:hypothetical protein n=1 Tax=Pseudomonas TaxID=286 RepID=UPI0002A26E5C|nr:MULTISPECIES: hypothetical protein [Pseudomonas]MDG9885539.1 hypothetical protein [Pseudomonas sp. GD04058]